MAELTIGDVIARAEEQLFVGRARELRVLHAWLSAAPEVEILNIYGPRGIGKSTLVRAFCRQARAQGRSVRFVDGRRLRDNPNALLEALQGEVNGDAGAGELGPAPLIVFDGLEEISSLTDYLLLDYLPTLPIVARIVICSVRQLDAAWARHDAWLRLVRSVAVPPLSELESETYLLQRGVDDRRARTSIVEAANGHPLALSLAASLAIQRGIRDFSAAPEWQMTVACLLEHVLSEVKDASLRDILRRSASEEELDEHVLSKIAGPEEAAVVFDQLSQLSFIRPAQHGLRMHDTVRRFLVSDVQWRRRLESRSAAGSSNGHQHSRPVDMLRLLTRRERELAILLARGRTTNRDIANELVISNGTANLHVKHMLSKLGFATRAELAAWLARYDDALQDLQQA